jgi:glutamate dehydrogenase/leucine dehydrogenase
VREKNREMDRNCCEAIANTLQRKLSLMARAQGTWHGICFLPGGSASNSLAHSSSTAVTMCGMTCCTKNTLQQLSWKLSSQSLCQDVVLHTKIRVPRKRSSSLEVAAIDAAQSFDYESLRMEELQSGNKLKIGIVGFGNFGQFLAQRMISQGHKVLAYSRTDYKDVAHTMGVPFFRYGSKFIGTVR